MWCEEELREIEPELPARRTGARSLAASLRRSLSDRNLTRTRTAVHPHEVTRGASVIYGPAEGSHGNFIDASYRRICANPEWRQRLEKVHTSKRMARATGPDEVVRSWRELDAATSSDALLMNIFCYPRVLATPRLPALLGLPTGLVPEFGHHPRVELERKLIDRTEIDLRLGNVLIEAKLTEADFQFAPLRLLERYPGFAAVFDVDALESSRRGVCSYQLIRGVLAAHADGSRFCVLSDARRPDLIEAWFAVMRAVRSYQMQSRLRLLTWQEVAGTLPLPLRRFLSDKYGIDSGDTITQCRHDPD